MRVWCMIWCNDISWESFLSSWIFQHFQKSSDFFDDVSATFISCTLFHSYRLQIFRSEASSTWKWRIIHFCSFVCIFTSARSYAFSCVCGTAREWIHYVLVGHLKEDSEVWVRMSCSVDIQYVLPFYSYSTYVHGLLNNCIAAACLCVLNKHSRVSLVTMHFPQAPHVGLGLVHNLQHSITLPSLKIASVAPASRRNQ